jgi:hypothetical protein
VVINNAVPDSVIEKSLYMKLFVAHSTYKNIFRFNFNESAQITPTTFTGPDREDVETGFIGNKLASILRL